MEGWIKLYRHLSENPLWLIKPFSEGQAWVDLLLITTFDKGFIKTKNGTKIKLNRGECGYSVLTLSQRWGWSRGKVTRFLSFLKSEEMIQQKIVSNTTIINILNYDNYQNDTINDTINGQQTDTIKNVKNDNSNISYINISSSSNSKKDLPQISEEEEKLLRKRAEKNKIKYFKPWLRKILTNGDYVEILNEEKKKHKVVENKTNEMKENFKKVNDKYKASMFIGMYGDYTDENHPEEVRLLMEKYDIPSFTEAVRYQHEYKKN